MHIINHDLTCPRYGTVDDAKYRCSICGRGADEISNPFLTDIELRVDRNNQLMILIELNFKIDSRDAIQVNYDVCNCPHPERLVFTLGELIPRDLPLYYRSVQLKPYQIDGKFVGMIGECPDCRKVYYKTC